MAAFSDDRLGKTLYENYEIRNVDNIEPAKDVLQKSLIHLVSNLLDNGSDVNKEDKEGITALHHAVSKYNDMMANALLENGADINKQNKEGQTALFQAVKQGIDYKSRKGSYLYLYNIHLIVFLVCMIKNS